VAPPPSVDTDGDGVTDDVDRCDTTPGPVSNKGCPIPAPQTTIGDGPVPYDNTAPYFSPRTAQFSVGGGARLECRLLPAEQEWGECPRNNEGRVTYINLSHGDTHIRGPPGSRRGLEWILARLRALG